jgi:hypothetical protein
MGSLLSRSPHEIGEMANTTVTHAAAAFDTMPDDLLWQIFTRVDSKTLMTVVPRVCRRWRALCGDTPSVRVDLSTLSEKTAMRRHALDDVGAELAAALSRRFRRATSAVVKGCVSLLV